jgi:hypothetical protein
MDKLKNLCNSEKNYHCNKISLHISLLYEEHVSTNVANQYSNILSKLHEEFYRLFKKFKKAKNKVNS